MLVVQRCLFVDSNRYSAVGSFIPLILGDYTLMHAQKPDIGCWIPSIFSKFNLVYFNPSL